MLRKIFFPTLSHNIVPVQLFYHQNISVFTNCQELLLKTLCDITEKRCTFPATFKTLHIKDFLSHYYLRESWYPGGIFKVCLNIIGCILLANRDFSNACTK